MIRAITHGSPAPVPDARAGHTITVACLDARAAAAFKGRDPPLRNRHPFAENTTKLWHAIF